MKYKIPVVLLLCAAPLFLKAQADTSSDVNKLLDLSLEELMNIKVVTATGYMIKTIEAPSTVQVVTAQQISERGYEQLEDALRDIPGIDMIHINGYAPTLIYFRGMYGAENLRALLMIDGIVENNIIGSNDMAGPAYSLHNVERIEIISGPASALYGANAFGGVINIITKKGEKINGFYGEKGYGSFNTSIDKVSYGFRKNRFDIAVSGSLYSTDGPKFGNRDPLYTGSYVDKAHSFNGAITYYGKKSTSILGYRNYRTPMGWGTYANSPTVYLGLPPQGNSNIGVIGILSRDIRGEKSGLDNSFLQTLFVQHEYKPDDKLNIFGRFVYRETGTDDDSYAYVTVDGNRMIRALVASSSNRVSGELGANYSLNKKHQFSAGLQYYQDNVESGSRKATFDPTVYLWDGRDTITNLKSTFLPREFDIRTNIGGYFQYVLNTSLLVKTNFTLGFRYDNNSYFGSAASPRLVIVNQPSDKLTFKFQFGTAFRAPTNLEIHQTGLNFNLTTEKLKTYEVNAIYAFSKTVSMQLNGFRNELKDVIIISSLSGLNPNKNPGVFTINGIEANLNMAFSKKIYGFINFTLQDARGKNLVTTTQGDLPGIAKAKGNAGLTINAAEFFTLSVTGNWVGSRHAQRTNPNGDTKGYFLLNCNLTTKPVFKDRITASINIRNLLNTKWLDPGFRTADGSLYSTVLEQPEINGLFKICLSLNNN